jgi:hypothetical protein
MKIYCTTYCNFGHRVDDGKPVDHECYILPTAVLKLEMDGDYDGALEILRTSVLKSHRGIRTGSKKRAKGQS